MSVPRRMSDPLKAPARRVIERYHDIYEGLIHAVKNELAGRFDQVDDQISTSHSSISDQLVLEASALRGLEADLEQVRALLGDTRDELATTRKELADRITEAVPSVRLNRLVGARLHEIDGRTTEFLNYAGSHTGPLADAGLWINHPVVVEWRPGSAALGAVNERIIEQPFVFASLADLEPGARVLDIGGAESTVSLALASSGYQVTVIEPQGYPFAHPNLTIYAGTLEDFASEAEAKADEPFDAVILLSTIEHFGIGHYANEPDPSAEADLAAMTKVAALLGDGGRLVLTTPYGPAAITDVERIYDRERLEHLLSGWDIGRVAIGRQVDRLTWEIESHELTDPAGPDRVVMLVATRSLPTS